MNCANMCITDELIGNHPLSYTLVTYASDGIDSPTCVTYVRTNSDNVDCAEPTTDTPLISANAIGTTNSATSASCERIACSSVEGGYSRIAHTQR